VAEMEAIARRWALVAGKVVVRAWTVADRKAKRRQAAREADPTRP